VQLKLSKSLADLNLCYRLSLLIEDAFPIRLLEGFQFFGSLAILHDSVISDPNRICGIEEVELTAAFML
jgi:hypothetical protein